MDRPENILPLFLLAATILTLPLAQSERRFRGLLTAAGSALLLVPRLFLLSAGDPVVSSLLPVFDTSGVILAILSPLVLSRSTQERVSLKSAVLHASSCLLVYLLPLFMLLRFLPGTAWSAVWAETYFLVFITAATISTSHRRMETLKQYNREMIREMGDGEKRFRLLFEESPDAIIWVDPELGLIMNCNPAAELFTGRKRNELIGAHRSVLMPPDEGGAGETAFGAGTSSGKETEITLLTGDGLRIPVMVTPTVISVGSVKIIQGVLRDLRERKEVEKEKRNNEENFKAILDAITESAFLTDTEGRILAANRTLAVLLGRDMEELGGASIFDALPMDTSTVLRQKLADVVRTGEHLRFTYEHAGRILDASFVPIPAPTGGVDRVAVFKRDITEVRQSELRVRRFMKELERSNRDLERFAYIVSHDLQEPLRSIRMFIERLESRYAESFDEKGRDYLHRVVSGGTRMEQMVLGLLQYSRVSSKGGDFVECGLDGVLRDTLDSLHVTLLRSGAEIVAGPLPVLRVDPIQMGQVFQNLIVNAIKYAKDGVKPVVTIRAGCTAGRWEIGVKDNGIGIAPEHHDRIFEIFQRVHDTTKYQGTGIGLAVCKRILERHGGTIRVVSAPGEGSEFILSLPAHGEHDPQEPAVDAGEQNARTEVASR